MPRTLVFGTGALFIALDERHQIRELTYPYVGLLNHLSGEPIRMGVWIDGHFEWTDSVHWTIEQRFEPKSNIARTRLSNEQMSIALDCEDGILGNCYWRKIVARNLLEHERELRLFFTHPLTVGESDIADTALFLPKMDAVVHYKGQTAIAFSARTQNEGLFEYATGIRGFGGSEGTSRDAEDGTLSMNPIAQGTVDSTLSVRMTLPARGEAEAKYVIRCAQSVDELLDLDSNPGEGALFESTVPDVPEPGQTENQREVATSLRFLAAHLDFGPHGRSPDTPPRGALIAAIDSDIMKTNRANYACFWPRDGAFAMEAFDIAGDPEPARRMFEFCASLIRPARPFFLQKYRPDGALGASWHPWIVDGEPETPLQEDETALVLWAMGKHGERFGWKWVGDLWERLAEPCAEFLIAYRDPATGLPKPSYDLWEERRGIHAFTCGTVIAGLRAVSAMADALGKPNPNRYAEAAEGFRQSLFDHFWTDKASAAARRLAVSSDGTLTRDQTPDSSMLHLILLGVLLPEDPRSVALVERIERELWAPGPVGGLARYSDDYYFRRSHETPGNPWIITTLWLARALNMLSPSDRDRTRARELLEWVRQRMASTGALPEQVDPLTGEPLSVAPLAWSHAEYVVASLELNPDDRPSQDRNSA